MARLVRTPLGVAQFTVAASAISLGTVTLISGGTVNTLGAETCLIVPETNGIRYRDAGGTATASVGMPIAAAGALEYDGNIPNLSIIAQSGTATVNVAFYGGGAAT